MGVVLTALGEDALGLGEHVLIDQRLVAVRDGDPPQGHLSDVDRIPEYAQNLVPGPLAAGGGAVSSVIGDRRDDLATQPITGVQGEDQSDDGRLGRYRKRRGETRDRFQQLRG